MVVHDDEQFSRITALWTRVQPTTAAYISSFVNKSHDVEELLQEVALGIVQNFDQYDPARSEVSWVLGIARHKVTDYLRRCGREPRFANHDSLATVASAYEQLHPEMADRRAALRSCIQLLKHQPRRILELYYEEGLKAQEVANQLSVSSNVVWVTLHRIRHTLLECIRRKVDGVRP